jgi:hypothetical protein
LISETSIEFSLASGVISSMANHGKSPSKSHWPMLFLLKDARWLRRFLNGVPHFVWCDWCNLYKTPMFIIYNCLYIYIYAQLLGFAQALHRRGFPFTNKWCCKLP